MFRAVSIYGRYAKEFDHMAATGIYVSKRFKFVPYKDTIYFIIDVLNVKDNKGRYINLNDPSLSSKTYIDQVEGLSYKKDSEQRIVDIDGVKITYNGKQVTQIGAYRIILVNYNRYDYPSNYINQVTGGGNTFKLDRVDGDGNVIYKKETSGVLGTSSAGILVVSKK